MGVVALSTLLGSATAGLFGRAVCHPMDTCKAQIQAMDFKSLKTTTFKSLFVLKNILATDGLLGLYRGIGVALVGGIPATCLYLTSYEVSKKRLSEVSLLKESPFMVYLCSGMIAETVSCVVFVPVDVIKERLQVQSVLVTEQARSNKLGMISAPFVPYKHSLDAFTSIVRNEGLRGGLYRGFGVTLLSFGPFSALYFLFYEKMKELYHKLGNDSMNLGEVGFLPSLCLSASAGSAASFVTNPLDLIKLRIQIQRRMASASSAEFSSLSVRGLFGHIYRTEGLSGLFRGAGARVLFHAPSTAITMAFFETFQLWWSKKLG